MTAAALRVGAVGVLVAAGVAYWLITGPLHRDDPNNPPTTITWHGWPYRNLGQIETLESATAFEHQAVAYASLKLERTSEDGGLAIYSLPLNVYVNATEGCNGPWFFHLKVGTDRYWRYQRPGGP